MCFWRDSVCFAPPAGSAQPRTLTGSIRPTARFVSSLLKTAKQTGEGGFWGGDRLCFYTKHIQTRDPECLRGCVLVICVNKRVGRRREVFGAKTNENLHFRSENSSQRSRKGKKKERNEPPFDPFLPKNTHVEHTVPTFVVKICDRWISVRRERTHAHTHSVSGSEARSAELSTSLSKRWRCEREVKLVLLAHTTGLIQPEETKQSPAEFPSRWEKKRGK